MKLIIKDLIFEVTRKCNMECDHCLRGYAQNIDISDYIIDATLEQINEICCITFSGGEPTLNVDAIEYTLETLKRNSLDIACFYVVTNGLLYSPKFVLALLEYAAYCYEPEMAGLSVSLDQFHADIPLENLKKYKMLSFYRNDREKNIKWEHIINEGFASENNIGQRQVEPKKEFFFDLYDDVLMIEELYINAKGDILGSCDCSYETQKKYKLGNVLERPLKETLMDYCQLKKIA